MCIYCIRLPSPIYNTFKLPNISSIKQKHQHTHIYLIICVYTYVRVHLKMCSFKSKEMNGTVASLAKSMQNLYSLILLLDVGWGQITTHLTSHTNLIDTNIHIHTYVCKYVYTCMYHPNMSEQTNAHFF